MRFQKKFVAGAAGAVLLSSAFMLHPADANEVTEFQTVFNTDVAYAGLGGMRGIGSGSIELSGVSGPVTQALLYWHGPTDSSDPDANAAVTFNGSSISGTNIGLGNDNCWDYDNSQAYRADVTALVSGNGSYSLANFTKPDVDINGASLVVFFDDGDAGNNRDVVMFDGNDSNVESSFDPAGWDVTLSGINYTSGEAGMDLIVSDGQDFDDGAVSINGTEITSGNAIFQGDTVPSAGSDNDGFLWDIKSYDVTSFLTPGLNSLNLTSPYESDCLSLIVAAVNLPAGSAPGQPTTTTTTESPTTTQAPTTTSAARTTTATPRFTG